MAFRLNCKQKTFTRTGAKPNLWKKKPSASWSSLPRNLYRVSALEDLAGTSSRMVHAAVGRPRLFKPPYTSANSRVVFFLFELIASTLQSEGFLS